jgi:hypothetical protein
MADNHAYVPAPGTIVPVINHLRSSFPVTITSDTLKKLGFAPKNESYVINVLRYLGILDENSKKTSIAAKIFSVHEDEAFQKAFSELVKNAYSDLFELHSDNTWTLDTDSLITFFRQSDQISAITGKRQASTFKILAGFSGYGEFPTTKGVAQKQSKSKIVQKAGKKSVKGKTNPDTSLDRAVLRDGQGSPVGLTVRIEINLPADGDQETYDRIFTSIRENLLNG